jgi:hypothetical protein
MKDVNDVHSVENCIRVNKRTSQHVRRAFNTDAYPSTEELPIKNTKSATSIDTLEVTAYYFRDQHCSTEL